MQKPKTVSIFVGIALLLSGCNLGGTLKEAFGSGTAAIISPVGRISYKGEEHVVGGDKVGELSQKIYDTILGMQYGETPAPDGWVERIDV